MFVIVNLHIKKKQKQNAQDLVTFLELPISRFYTTMEYITVQF